MKKATSSFAAIAATLILAGSVWAETMMGNLTKIDEKGSFYFLEIEKGKETKIHFDASTKKKGDIKVGAHVVVDEENGHAKSIEAMDMGQ